MSEQTNTQTQTTPESLMEPIRVTTVVDTPDITQVEDWELKRRVESWEVLAELYEQATGHKNLEGFLGVRLTDDERDIGLSSYHPDGAQFQAAEHLLSDMPEEYFDRAQSLAAGEAYKQEMSWDLIEALRNLRDRFITEDDLRSFWESRRNALGVSPGAEKDTYEVREFPSVNGIAEKTPLAGVPYPHNAVGSEQDAIGLLFRSSGDVSAAAHYLLRDELAAFVVECHEKAGGDVEEALQLFSEKVDLSTLQPKVDGLGQLTYHSSVGASSGDSLGAGSGTSQVQDQPGFVPPSDLARTLASMQLDPASHEARAVFLGDPRIQEQLVATAMGNGKHLSVRGLNVLSYGLDAMVKQYDIAAARLSKQDALGAALKEGLTPGAPGAEAGAPLKTVELLNLSFARNTINPFARDNQLRIVAGGTPLEIEKQVMAAKNLVTQMGAAGMFGRDPAQVLGKVQELHAQLDKVGASVSATNEHGASDPIKMRFKTTLAEFQAVAARPVKEMERALAEHRAARELRALNPQDNTKDAKGKEGDVQKEGAPVKEVPLSNFIKSRVELMDRVTAQPQVLADKEGADNHRSVFQSLRLLRDDAVASMPKDIKERLLVQIDVMAARVKSGELDIPGARKDLAYSPRDSAGAHVGSLQSRLQGWIDEARKDPSFEVRAQLIRQDIAPTLSPAAQAALVTRGAVGKDAPFEDRVADALLSLQQKGLTPELKATCKELLTTVQAHAHKDALALMSPYRLNGLVGHGTYGQVVPVAAQVPWNERDAVYFVGLKNLMELTKTLRASGDPEVVSLAKSVVPTLDRWAIPRLQKPATFFMGPDPTEPKVVFDIQAPFFTPERVAQELARREAEAAKAVAPEVPAPTPAAAPAQTEGQSGPAPEKTASASSSEPNPAQAVADKMAARFEDPAGSFVSRQPQVHWKQDPVLDTLDRLATLTKADVARLSPPDAAVVAAAADWGARHAQSGVLPGSLDPANREVVTAVRAVAADLAGFRNADLLSDKLKIGFDRAEGVAQQMSVHEFKQAKGMESPATVAAVRDFEGAADTAQTKQAVSTFTEAVRGEGDIDASYGKLLLKASRDLDRGEVRALPTADQADLALAFERISRAALAGDFGELPKGLLKAADKMDQWAQELKGDLGQKAIDVASNQLAADRGEVSKDSVKDAPAPAPAPAPAGRSMG